MVTTVSFLLYINEQYIKKTYGLTEIMFTNVSFFGKFLVEVPLALGGVK